MHVSVVALERMLRRSSGQLHVPRDANRFARGAISSQLSQRHPQTWTLQIVWIAHPSCSRLCCKYHVATRGLLIDRGAVTVRRIRKLKEVEGAALTETARQNMTLESGRQHNAQRMRYHQRDLLRPALCVYTRNRPLKWSQPQSMCSSLRPGGRPRPRPSYPCPGVVHRTCVTTLQM